MTRYTIRLLKPARIHGKRIETGQTVDVDALIYSQLRYHNACELVREQTNRADAVDVAFEEVVESTSTDNTLRPLDSYTREEIIAMNAKEQRALIEAYNVPIAKYKSLRAPELEQAVLDALGLGGGLV